MIFIPVNSNELPIKIKLNKSYGKNLIGIVNFQLNGLKGPALIDVTCNQIDSTVENPKRILKVLNLNIKLLNIYSIKTLAFNRVNNTNRDWYLTWEATNIEFYPLDSCDQILEVNVSKTFKGDLEFLPTHRPNFPDHDPCVIFTLVINPITERENKWNCI